MHRLKSKPGSEEMGETMNLIHTTSRYKVTKGPLMTVRTSVVATLLLSVSLFASSDAEKDRYDKIQSKLNSIINKAGIHFNGTFRSQYLQSMLDNANSGDSAVDWRKKQTESSEYTSVDFDIGARPNEALSARCMFRMHQNWQNFFSDVSNPIFLRWMSIDGNIKDMFRFNVGDFRQRYSPLTLWSPDIAIEYEPEIFAEKRRQAMNELFLGNNDRLLQGVNFNLDAELVPVLNELHFNLQGNRLRLSEVSIKNGSAVAADFENDRITIDKTYMDRYFVGGNLDAVALGGLGFGVTEFRVFDVPATSTVGDPELIAQDLNVMAVRLKPSTKIFLDSDVFEAGLQFEYAMTNDRDSAWYEFDTAITSRGTGLDTTIDSSVASKYVNGTALDVGLNGKVKLGDIGKICFNVGYMNNSRDFRNQMAQTPSFIGQRIMNIENDFEHNARLYTTFDAMYDYVFKFIPSKNNDWTQEPRRKTSYLNSILTSKELAALDGVNARYDSTLQLVLPAGQATANRMGPKGDLKLSLFEGGVDLSGSFASLTEVETAADGIPKTSFMKAGGGVSVDLGTWAKVLNTCRLSFGYALESAENEGAVAIDISKLSFKSGFLNAGLYYNFWQRFSLLGGFQQIVSTRDVVGMDTFKKTVTQLHWAVGLEYKVNEDQKVIGRFGEIGADFESNRIGEETIADYNFRAKQVEVFLAVNF